LSAAKRDKLYEIGAASRFRWLCDFLKILASRKAKGRVARQIRKVGKPPTLAALEHSAAHATTVSECLGLQNSAD